MPSSAPMWFTRPKTVTHSGTNRTWRRVTTLIVTDVLSLSQTGNQPRKPPRIGVVIGTKIRKLYLHTSVPANEFKLGLEHPKRSEQLQLDDCVFIGIRRSNTFRLKA